MLVLWSLGPRCHQVGQLEVPRRQVASDNAGLVFVVFIQNAALAASQVLTDVVEVDIDGGHRAPPGPFARRRVEDHVNIANARFTLDEGAQGGVHLIDHPLSLANDADADHSSPIRREGMGTCPFGHLSAKVHGLEFACAGPSDRLGFRASQRAARC